MYIIIYVWCANVRTVQNTFTRIVYNHRLPVGERSEYRGRAALTHTHTKRGCNKRSSAAIFRGRRRCNAMPLIIIIIIIIIINNAYTMCNMLCAPDGPIRLRGIIQQYYTRYNRRTHLSEEEAAA